MSFNPIKTPVATIEMLFVTIMEMCCCIMPYQSQSPELTIPMMQVSSAISSADFSLMILMICGINNAEDIPPAINRIVSLCLKLALILQTFHFYAVIFHNFESYNNLVLPK